ncbi:MAG: hypothetical protein S4CHLAM45_05280 [Chlamydiales bacterium]|nr:hypothetical protein [Chlamydiales bacterium]MCH9619931.1 hypothetical protein [Chlamydiales bacterium]MCH9622642.1 hypothetical protein [Chlamydiales bacterium]
MKTFFLWHKTPALLYGLTYLLGTLFALCSPWALFPLPFLIGTIPKKLPHLVFLFLLPLPLIQNGFQKQEEGTFKISSIKHNFSWTYSGKLNHVPCYITTKKPLDGRHHHIVKGKWTTDKTFKAEEISPLMHTFSLAKWRYDSKKRIKQTVQKLFRYQRSATFISALLTGELNDLEMKKEFSQLGLLHLLAISGFHFGLLVFLLHFLLNKILPPKIETIVTALLMTLFALFIGNSPSVQRAWIFMMIYLGGEFLEKKTYALNTLGAALWIGLLLDPFSCLSIGFQLSFLATGGLLLFYRPIDRLLQIFFPKPTLYEASCHSFFWQIGYLFTAFFRELSALTLAVNLTILPLLLYHFHLFHPIGLLFNLFFPFLTAIALSLLPLYPITDLLTHWMLKLTTHNYGGIYIEEMPLWLMVVCVTLIGAVGLTLQEFDKRIKPL